jgi:hypothetical protein
MTWAQLRKLIDQGIGQGHLDTYIPFRQLSRRNISRFGNQAFGNMPGYRRTANFFNRSQRYVALVLLWAGALDVREQYPLWPQTHPHPLADWPLGYRTESLCHGVLELREQVNQSKRIVQVPLADLMLTVGTLQSPRCMLISCMSASSTAGTQRNHPVADPVLVRRYAQANELSYRAIDVRMIDRTLLGNLKALAYSVNEVRHLAGEVDCVPLFDRLRISLEGRSIVDAVKRTSAQSNVSARQLWIIFHFMAWHQMIDIDLRCEILTTECMVPSDVDIRLQTRKVMLGGPA